MTMDKTVKTLVILFALMGLALLGYYWLNQWHTDAVEEAVQKEKEACLTKIARLEADVQRLAEEAGLQPQALPSKADLTPVFGADKPMLAGQGAVNCKKVTAQTVAFFQYLDSKAYLIWPGINMRADELFEDVFNRLAANPPTNVGEMDNLYNLIRNVTHFYRVLGKDRIDLIKEILSSESAVVEPAMAVMFTWMTVCDQADTKTGEPAKLSTLYQYASFFLNTLGGRGYLLRRDSKLRMLVNYYALRVLDMANDARLNAYGIDLRPHLDYIFYDINNQKGLMYRQRYLSHLAALKDKYE
jgi:hypothetical protein